MKRLILMRHAKSAWDEPALDDFDRPLNARGRRGAEAVGGWLAAEGLAPAVALVSAAARTRETWERLALPEPASGLRFERRLYHAAPETMLGVLREAGAAETALMLGHQPGIGAMALRLPAAPPDDPAYGAYPTAATAVIAFDVADWRAADWGAGRVEAFVTPASLGAGRG